MSEQKRTEHDPDRPRFLLRFWPIGLAAMALAACLLVGAAGLLLYAELPQREQVEAEMLIIPGPSSTVSIPTATATIEPSPTSNLPPSPLPGMIGVGSSVQIFGTDGTGLNIREEAGLSASVKFLALDSEAFVVIDGPIVKDGFTWWLIKTPVDEDRYGWAASNYLSLLPSSN